MRYPESITARNPRTGTLHHVAVERDFGQLPNGSVLPREAFARTLCITGGRQDATGWIVGFDPERHFCGSCG